MNYIKYEDDENWVLWVCPDPECDEVIHDPGSAGPIICTNYDVHTLGEYPDLVRTPVTPVDPDIEALLLNRRRMAERYEMQQAQAEDDVRDSYDADCACETDERCNRRCTLSELDEVKDIWTEDAVRRAHEGKD